VTEPRPAEITVNGSTRPLASDETITDLVSAVTGRSIAADGRALDGRRLGVAVARNAEVVPRSRWAETTLTPGDGIEIVTAVQGG
jgi:sulfur carrier protein